MEISSLQSPSTTANVPFERLAKNPNVSDSDKVKESCKQFEAVLIRQMLSDARKTVIQSGQTDSSAKGIYDDMINNQLADSMSHSGGFGLAKSLEAQLVSQSVPKKSCDDIDEPETNKSTNLNKITNH